MPEKSLLPFVLLGAGFLWAGIFEWLRQRFAKKQAVNGTAPANHHLTLVGMAGLLFFMTAAAIAAYMKWFP